MHEVVAPAERVAAARHNVRDGPHVAPVGQLDLELPLDPVEEGRHRVGRELVAAHVLAPCAGVGEALFVVYSPRKLLSVPWLGCLVVDGAERSRVPEAQDAPSGSGSWLFRRLTQRVMRAAGLDWHRRWMKSPEDLPSRAERFVEPGWRGSSRFARSMLANDERRLTEIRDLRRRNYQRLSGYVERSDLMVPLFARLPDDGCPYVFPVRVHAEIERVLGELKSVGVPASRWPDLPLEVLAEPARHRMAIALARTLMLLPIHHGLSISDIDTIGGHLVRIRASAQGVACAS